MKRFTPLYLFCGLIFFIGTVATLTCGAIPWSDVWSGVINRFQNHSSEWNPLLDERLPRLIVLLCTGASLAVSGAVLQALFHNPLASPSILGMSCGGSLLVTLVFSMQWHLYYPYSVPMAAFVGSLSTLLLVYGLSKRKGELHITILILTGIAVSTLLLAIQGAITYALRNQWQLIQTLTEWEAGSTADRSWKHVHMQLPITLVGIWGCLSYREEINILALGEEEAKNLGVEVEKVRWHLFLCVALLTGGALAAVGLIAFFGLVLPHLIRRLCGPDSRYLIPINIFAGGTTLLFLDVLLRFFHIHAFSIGNISTILGGIFFLVLLTDLGQNSKRFNYA